MEGIFKDVKFLRSYSFLGVSMVQVEVSLYKKTEGEIL